MMPGVVIHGTATVEWLEGERFLMHRSRMDHPEFPAALAVIGDDAQDRAGSHDEAQLCMHYFDSRGVFRRYDVSADDTAWRYWRDDPGFSQRFTGTFTDGGNTIVGVSQLKREDTWEDDLKITYRRSPSATGAG